MKQNIFPLFINCKLYFSSANATPAFEGRGGEQLAAELSRFLYLAHSPILNLSKLCIVSGQSCWKLFVDVLILECGGKNCSAFYSCDSLN